MPSSFPQSDLSVLDQPGVKAWLSALATTSQKLADAQDETELAATVRKLAVPALGDLSELYAFDGAGVLQPIVGPDLEPTTPLGRLHAHEARSLQATAVLARVAHDRIAQVIDADLVIDEGADSSWLAMLTNDAQHLALLQALGLRAVVLAPLAARGTVVGLLLLGSADRAREYDGAAMSVVGLLAGAISSALVARVIEQREAMLNDRLDGLIQAARELAHVVNNDLTLPVGAVEIMLDRPEHPPELREMLAAAASDLSAAEQHIRGFHQIARGEAPLPQSKGRP